MGCVRFVVVACLMLAGGARAVADPSDPIDTEAAKRHFELGRSLYADGKYEEACREFSSAHRLLDVPALDYNLGKCEERLEHWQGAIDAYERYLARAPNDEKAAEVRSRMEVLRARLPPVVVAAPPDPRPRRLRLAAIGLAAGAVALAGAGAGAYYSSWRDYQTKRTDCMMTACPSGSYASLTNRVHIAEAAAYSLWAIAGAAAVADVTLWVLSRRHGPTVHASLSTLRVAF